jgi:hypothetical protein
MLSSVLRSGRAVQVNIEIVRAFVPLRTMLAGNVELARKLAALERKYDAQFKVVFDAIRELMEPPAKPRRPIGFRPEVHGDDAGRGDAHGRILAAKRGERPAPALATETVRKWSGRWIKSREGRGTRRPATMRAASSTTSSRPSATARSRPSHATTWRPSWKSSTAKSVRASSLGTRPGTCGPSSRAADPEGADHGDGGDFEAAVSKAKAYVSKAHALFDKFHGDLMHA